MHNDVVEENSKLPVGTLLSGRYEITGDLGEGGFAVVYRGRDVEIEREIAIKVLNLSNFKQDLAAYENVLARFRREARTSARIQHPNAVTIYDFGETEQGSPFIVMELLHGHDLEVELATAGALGIERALKLFIPTLEALGKAHTMGIVHKDLKPSNLFIADAGTNQERMVILDFGVARINTGDDSAKLTTAGQVLGTPQYMAPEYIESQLATPALDVYQMGLIIAEAISGKTLVDEENMVTCLIKHTTGNFEVPVEVVNSPLGPVIATSLSKDHTERFDDGQVFRQALIDLNILNTVTMEAINHPPQALVSNVNPNGHTEVVDWSPPSGQNTVPPQAQVPAPTQKGSWLMRLGIGAGVLTGVAVMVGLMMMMVFMLLIFAVAC